MPARQKYKLTKKEALPWVSQYESAKNYLSKINSAKADTALNLFHFCNWVEMSPTELLALKSSFESLDAERLLDKFVYSRVSLPDSTKWRVIQNVRGFFRANYRQLQAQAGKMEYTPKKPQRFPTKAQRYDLFRACYNPRDRALTMMGLCSSIALESMSCLCWLHFEEDWQRQNVPYIQLPSEIIKGHGKGKYRGVLQFPFITPECKRVLLDYRDWYGKTFRYCWREEDHVFLSVRDNVGESLSRAGISQAVLQISKRAGVKFGLHDGRRIVQTALESVGVSPQWIRKIKGRKVSGEENPYSKPAIEQLRAKYREALGELEFLKQQVSGEMGVEGFSDDDLTDISRLLEDYRTGKLRYI